MGKDIILSGMRPTGRLHLGNYLGALKNWVQMQDKYNSYFFIADWHALMSNYDDPVSVSRNCREMLSVWLAVGLDPEKCVIFRQSDIPEHLELFFIFSTITPLGWLKRCPTYKEALLNEDKKDIRNYAFLGYPALQAADIVLYKANKVPVGKDQLAHLELTREIIRRFNHLYDTDVMVEPDAVLTKVRNLKGTDGRKMSKSYGNTIYLIEEPDELKNKVNNMITDPARIRVDDKGHPEVCSVFSYHKIFNRKGAKELKKECTAGTVGCVACKKKLFNKLDDFIKPIREKYLYYMENPKKVNKILEEGNSRAKKTAAENLKLFKDAMNYG